MRILLTGPTGFIGSAFARLALKSGHEIAGLIVPGEDPPADLVVAPGLRWMRGTLDSAPWDQLRVFEPQVCVHCAWITTPGVYLESPDNYKFRDSSLAFLQRMVDFGTRCIVGLGTCIEYKILPPQEPGGGVPLSEEHSVVEPATTYARCKDELRRALEAEAITRNFDFAWARVFYPYGPGEHPSRLCSSIIRKLRAGEAITLKTPDSTKDYIYIQDLARALLTVVEKSATGTINLGTGIPVSVREIARMLERMLDKQGLVHEAQPPEQDPMGYVVADAARLKSLGWQPEYSMEAGLRTLL